MLTLSAFLVWMGCTDGRRLPPPPPPPVPEPDHSEDGPCGNGGGDCDPGPEGEVLAGCWRPNHGWCAMYEPLDALCERELGITPCPSFRDHFASQDWHDIFRCPLPGGGTVVGLGFFDEGGSQGGQEWVRYTSWRFDGCGVLGSVYRSRVGYPNPYDMGDSPRWCCEASLVDDILWGDKRFIVGHCESLTAEEVEADPTLGTCER